MQADEWQERGVKEGLEFGILTNEMLKTWPGMKVFEYKQFKDLKKENLRDMHPGAYPQRFSGQLIWN